MSIRYLIKNNAAFALSRLVLVSAMLFSQLVLSEPVVSGDVISWPAGDWYQVQSAEDYRTVCNGGSSCQVHPGLYNVINHSTGVRWRNLTVPIDFPFTVSLGELVWPGDGWYQVQSQDAEQTFCNGGDSCQLDAGQYLVINHNSGQRWSAVQVEGVAEPVTEQAEISAIALGPKIDGQTIRVGDDGWYQIQNAETFESVCEGIISCDVLPGTYNVINHTTSQRWRDLLVASNETEPVIDPVSESESELVAQPKPKVVPQPEVVPEPEEVVAQQAGVCDSNVDSLQDQVTLYEETDFHELLAATQIPTLSPAIADADDIQIERSDLVNPDFVRIVVRKPTSTGPVVNLPAFPSDPVEAYVFLRQAFEQAAESGASRVVFPPNAMIALANSNPKGTHIALEDFSDTTFDLNGSALEFLNLAPGITIKNSQRIQIENGTLKSRELLSTIAQVEVDTKHSAGIRFRVLPEFIDKLEAQFAEDNIKPQLVTVGRAKPNGMSWQIDAMGNADLFANRGGANNKFVYSTSGAGAEKVAYFSGTADGEYGEPGFEPGQWVYLLHRNNNAAGIVMKNSDGDVEDISIKDMDLLNIPGMGIIGEVNRGVHLNNVRIIPDPDNALSFWGSSSDAFHLNHHGGDVVIENSYFGGSADDLVTAKGNWWKVSEIDRESNKVRVVNADRGYSVHLWAREGDRFVIIDSELNVMGSATSTGLSKKIKSKEHDVFIDEIPAGLVVGSLVANPDLSGGRMLIRDNYFSNSRAQGVLVQTSHVIIENNVFENIAGPAVKLNFALADWHEAVAVTNVLVQNNHFDRTAVGATKPPYSFYVNQKDGTGQNVSLITDYKLIGNSYAGELADSICQ